MVKDAFGLESIPAPRTAGGNDQVSVIRAASDLLARAQFANTAGITFGGKRDLFSVLGFPRNLVPKDYRDRYKRGGIAKRIVEAFPRATWRGGAELIEDEDPDISTDFEQTWEDLDKRLSIWTTLQRVDILAGLGPFAVLLIGATGDLEQELPKLGGPDGILYLTPYGSDEVTIQTYVEDVEDPRFGQPLLYSISRVGMKRSFSRRVHWSRVIHVADGLLEDTVNGTPRLESVWNDLDNLDKVVGGGSEAFWMRVNQGTVFGVDKDVKVGDAELTKLKEEAEELAHQLRRTFAARGVTVSPLGSNVAPFSSQVQTLISLISGTTSIPQRILLGSERGELASTQDKENWNVRVQDRREEYAEPITRDLVDRLVKYDGLPEPDEYEVRWPELDDLNEIERANVATQWKGLGETIVTSAEIRDRILRLDPMDEDQIAAVEEADAKKKEEEAAKQEADLAKAKIQAKIPPDPKAAGGSGSGNFGHGGRPGEVGGSGLEGAKDFKGYMKQQAKASKSLKTTPAQKKFEESVLSDTGGKSKNEWEGEGLRGAFEAWGEGDKPNIDAALKKAPSYEGVVYRGIESEASGLKNMKPGKSFKIEKATSATRSPKVARMFMSEEDLDIGGKPGHITLFKISTKSRAVAIENIVGRSWKSQREVAFRKGTKVKITAVRTFQTPRGKITVIEGRTK